MEGQERKVVQAAGSHIASLFGKLDENLVKLERAFAVSITNRGEDILVLGGRGTESAAGALQKLLRLVEKGEALSEQTVNYVIAAFEDESEQEIEEIEKLAEGVVCMTVSGRPIKAKTVGQQKYVEQIRKNTIVFGVGPAGTGKTYLAMAMAIHAFKSGVVQRIILTRPAIEAGEKLGFLPGDLQQKVDPYLRPLYDALHDIMGGESFQKYMEKGSIEVAPLAYMRGRTLDNAFIVLDEAQNTTPEQMKMFLTRIGFGSKVVVTGDVTQIDLPDGKKSGLNEAVALLSDVEDIGVSLLTNRDVVRHPLVQRIIKAYEKADARMQYKEKAEARRMTVKKYKNNHDNREKRS